MPTTASGWGIPAASAPEPEPDDITPQRVGPPPRLGVPVAPQASELHSPVLALELLTGDLAQARERFYGLAAVGIKGVIVRPARRPYPWRY